MMPVRERLGKGGGSVRGSSGGGVIKRDDRESVDMGDFTFFVSTNTKKSRKKGQQTFPGRNCRVRSSYIVPTQRER